MSSILRNISGRILVTVYLALLILSGYFITASYISHIKTAEKVELQRLYSISQTLSAQMDGNALEMILDSFPNKDDITDPAQDMYYNEQREILIRASKLNKLPTPLYTLSRDSSGNYFLGISSSDPLFYRHPYDTHPKELDENYETGGVIPRFEDAHGTWLSAVSPITNAEGRVIGVVEVDLPFDDFFAVAQGKLWRNILFTLAVFIVVGVLLYFQIRGLLRQDEQSKKKLEAYNQTIGRINTELQQKNKDITDSIDYASRIQKSIIPSPEQLTNHFKAGFVIYKPKDIVSGDFYWFHQVDEKNCFVAVVDCTGHGVPGAFMSLIGHTLLDEIVIERGIKSPAQILNQLNKMIISLLKKGGSNVNDGMDMALCCFNGDEKKLTFAGAFNPLVMVREQKCRTYKPNRFPIGGVHYDAQRSFDEQIIEIQPGDRFYMFSDGYVDQFGGEKDKKFMMKRLYPLLEGMNGTPMNKQKEVLEAEFLAWKKGNEQVDDVTFVGIEI